MSSLEATTCSASNTTCLCGSDSYRASVSSCVEQSCILEQALTIQNVTFSACGLAARDRSGEYVVVSLVFGIISTVIAIIRLVHKIAIIRKQFEIDDCLILLVVAVSAVGITVGVRGLAGSGLGRDVWTLTIPQIVAFCWNFFYGQVIYVAQVALLKLTLLFFYQRVFPGQAVQRVIWGTIVFVVLFGMIFTITSVAQCRPIHYYWDQYYGNSTGYCISNNALAWANAAISIALDLWMLAIPLSQLSKLDLHWRKKIGVSLMFCVGTFVTVVSILRLHTLITFANTTNPTWDEWGVCIYSIVEINVGIICICMPAMRMILMNMFPKVFGTTTLHSRQLSHNHHYNNNTSNNMPFNSNEKSAPYYPLQTRRQSHHSTTSKGTRAEMIAKRFRTPSPVSHSHNAGKGSLTRALSRSHGNSSNYPNDHNDPSELDNGHSDAYRSYDMRYGQYADGKVVWVNVNKPVSPPPHTRKNEEQQRSFFNW